MLSLDGNGTKEGPNSQNSPGGLKTWHKISQHFTAILQLIILLVCIWLLVIQHIVIGFLNWYGIDLFTNDYIIAGLFFPNMDKSEMTKLVAILVAGFSPTIISGALDKTKNFGPDNKPRTLLGIHIGSAVNTSLIGLALSAYGLSLYTNPSSLNYPMVWFCVFYLLISLWFLVAIYFAEDDQSILFRASYYETFIRDEQTHVCIPWLKPLTISNGLSWGRLGLGLINILYFIII